MIAGAVDILFVGLVEPPEADRLRRAGLAVERAESLLAAGERLRAGGAAVVIASGEACAGREHEAFASLREAGAGSILVLYPPAMSWRTTRALTAGADDSMALPAEPGLLEARIARLVRIGAGSVGASPASAAPTPGDGRPRASASLESLVGDVALLNRSVPDLDRLLEMVVQLFARRSAARRCSLLFVDAQKNELYVRQALGLPDDVPYPPVPVGKGFAGHVAKTGLPLLVADIERLRGPTQSPRSEEGTGYATRSCLLLPLRASQGVLGVLCLADKESGRPFDEADLGPLRFLADQIAQTVENAVQFRRLQELAAIDELTGLANRRQFQASLEREIQRARRYGRPFTLALFDVDHFKRYNDACGHQAGDKALALLGEILRTSLREVDIVARYGGEEFAAILPETAPLGDEGVSPFPFLERLRRRVLETAFEGESRLPGGKLTISGGVACFPEDAKGAEELVRAADQALYVSKSRGRNAITRRDTTVAGE